MSTRGRAHQSTTGKVIFAEQRALPGSDFKLLVEVSAKKG